MTIRAFALVTLPSTLAVALACFDPPELDELPPPPADLGSIDTFAAIDEAGPPSSGDDGPPSDTFGPGPDSGAELGSEEPGDPALAQLLITEVLADPEGKDGGLDSPEFIEITNPGPSPVKLIGLRVDAPSWPIVDAAELGIDGLTLEVGGHLLIRRWAKDVDPGLAAVEVSGLVIWTGFMHASGLRNADGAISIDAGTTSIDQVAYGIAPAEPGEGWTGEAVEAPGSGASLCRLEGPDTDSAADWASCPPNPGLLETVSEDPDDPRADPDPIPPGALVIVEVNANPPGPSSEEKPHEYVEILNISQNQVELSGCHIGDAPTLDAPGLDPLEHVGGDGGCESPTCLAPGARAIIVGQGYLGETGDALVLATDDSTIADGGLTNTEPVALWDALGNLASSYRLWPDPSVEPIPADEQPLHRIDPAAPDEPSSWISAPASPGL